VGRECQSDGLPYATPAAGDHGDFAVEPETLSVGKLIGHSETPRFHGMKSS
jgi:hypothetical protein